MDKKKKISPKEMTKKTSITMAEDVYHFLVEKAKKENKTMGLILTEVIREYMKMEDKRDNP